MVIRIRVKNHACLYCRSLQHVVTCCKLSYVSNVISFFLVDTICQRFALLIPHIFCPQPESYSEAQKTEMQDSLLYKELVEPAHWVGLRKCDDLLEYLRVRGTKHMNS